MTSSHIERTTGMTISFQRQLIGVPAYVVTYQEEGKEIVWHLTYSAWMVPGTADQFCY